MSYNGKVLCIQCFNPSPSTSIGLSTIVSESQSPLPLTSPPATLVKVLPLSSPYGSLSFSSGSIFEIIEHCHLLKVCFLCLFMSGQWGTNSDAQGLILVFGSEITPGRVKGPYVVLDMELGQHSTRQLLTYFTIGPIHCFMF